MCGLLAPPSDPARAKRPEGPTQAAWGSAQLCARQLCARQLTAPSAQTGLLAACMLHAMQHAAALQQVACNMQPNTCKHAR